MSIRVGAPRPESPLPDEIGHQVAVVVKGAAASVQRTQLTYAAAGVDIQTAEDFVTRIKVIAQATAQKGADAILGGFGVRVHLGECGITNPVVVLSTDGVGTKLMIAEAIGDHSTVGIDLVAMSANDALVEGARPLAFLDYLATGKLDPAKHIQVIEGIGKGCKQAGCALVGGETAEMPGMYEGTKYDLAGFVMAVAEKSQLLPKSDNIEAGNVLIGLSSSGLHSNGFSLIRRLLKDLELSYTDAVPFTSKHPNIGTMLLEPTRIYVKPVLPLIEEEMILAAAHITGGGLLRNIARVLPSGLGAVLNATKWPIPPVFSWVAGTGRVADTEMAKSLNLGLGMVLVVPKDSVITVLEKLRKGGEEGSVVGEVVVHEVGMNRIRINGLERALYL